MGYEYFPGTSILHRLDPRTKFLIFIMIVVLTVSIADPLGILGLLILTAILYRVAGIPGSKLRKMIISLLPVFALFIFLNWFVVPPKGAHLLFTIGSLPITIETTMVGVTGGLRFLLFICVARLLTMTTSIAELLVALVKLRVPKEAATALGIGFSSVAILIDKINTVREAQVSRGAKVDVRNPFKKLFALIPIIVPAIYLTILRGMDVAKALEARAFTYNPAGRTMRKHIRLTRLDYLVLAIWIAFTAAIAFLRFRCGWFDYMFTIGRFL